MSLAFWFNDYVFKQTTFKLRRWKQYASVTAVFITWILFGIWHGAGWNFMVLGLIQAIAINYEFFTKKTRASILKHLSPLTRRWFGRTMTYLFFGLSLVFFFSPNLSVALEYFSNLKNINLSGLATLLNNLLVDKFSFFIAFGIMAIMMLVETIACDREDLFDRSLTLFYSSKIEMRMLRYLLYYFVILLYFFYGGSDMEFVYFQF